MFRDDSGASAVVGVTLMVAITVVCSAMAFKAIQDRMHDEYTPKEAGVIYLPGPTVTVTPKPSPSPSGDPGSCSPTVCVDGP